MLRSGLLTSLHQARSTATSSTSPRIASLSSSARSSSLLSSATRPLAATWQAGNQQQQRFRSQLAPRRTKYRKAHKGRVAVRTLPQPRLRPALTQSLYMLKLLTCSSLATHRRLDKRYNPSTRNLRPPTTLLRPSDSQTTLFRRSRRQEEDQNRQGC